jgi:hypothetical protein
MGAVKPGRRRPAGFFRSSTRRIMALVAISAALMTGLHGGSQPGWHVPAPGGYRVGACRNDLNGRFLDQNGSEAGRMYQAGIWLPRGHGGVSVGLSVRDGMVTVFTSPDTAHVIL